jgi:thiol:disulfide interchange protein DsbD
MVEPTGACNDHSRMSVHNILLRLAAALLLLTGAMHVARAADDFLEPEKAFAVSARAADERTLEVRFDIADGYYMYREQFRFSAEGGTLGAPQVPAGKIKFDETFGKDVETHRGALVLRLPLQQAEPQALRVTVVSQGCADQGLCYPPMATVVEARLAGFGGDGVVRVAATGELPSAAAAAGVPAGPAATGASGGSSAAAAVNTASPTDLARIESALQGGRFWTVVGVFFVAGLLLSLTPCVLPMLPILSSIIVGAQGNVSRARGLLLAASYSLGMALLYTGLGVAAGLAGEGLAAALQKPWVLALFALMLFVFALSMFDVYELRLPEAWMGKLTATSQRLPAGQVAGVFAMGGLSALIVSPCVTAPLAGALVFIGQTRDVVLGGSALFAMSAGMSVPLLLLGASAGAWLPKSGSWMHAVKRFFGVLLVAVAIWVLQPALPVSVAMLLWGLLLLVTGFMLRPFEHSPHAGLPRVWLQRALGAAALTVGILQVVGAASGGRDPLQPLGHWTEARAATLSAPGTTAAALVFQPVGNAAQLDDALRRAAGRTVVLDFYADWCVSCKEMERFTFSDARVRERMTRALLLKADVTANTPEHRELLRRFGLFGPPGMLFFDASGQEIQGVRVIGFQSADRFLQTLDAARL